MDGARTGAAPTGVPGRKVAAGQKAVGAAPRAVTVLPIEEAPPAVAALPIVADPVVPRTVMARGEIPRQVTGIAPNAAAEAWIPTPCSVPRASRRVTPG
jgi:hypothetical protein